jgi:amino acid adenylation domain-containing protein
MSFGRSRQQERVRRLATTETTKRPRLLLRSLDDAALRRLAQAGIEVVESVDGFEIYAPYALFDLRSLLLLIDETPAKDEVDVLPYADYIHWQKGLDASISIDSEIINHRDRLCFGVGHQLRSEKLVRDVPDTVWRKTLAVAKKFGLSPEAMWIASFQLVLAHAADREAVRLCISHPGRPIEEIANALGLYGWSSDAPTTALEKPAKDVWQKIDKLLETAREHDVPPLDFAKWPGWPFAFAFISADRAQLPDFLSGSEETSPVALSIWWSSTCARLYLELREAPWPPGFADLLFDRLLASFTAALDNPGKPIGYSYRLGDAEMARLAAPPQALLPAEFVPFPKRVLDCARNHPEAVALIEPGRHLNYATLAIKIDTAAAALAGYGIGKGETVGLWMEQSLDAIIALLSIQRCGACAAILDATIPPTRIPQMLRSVGAVLCVSNLESIDGVRRITWDELVDRSTDGTWSPPALMSRDLAHILFTSGTTGTAKPVVISHGALDIYRSGILSRLPLQECTSFLLVSPLAVDLGYTMLIPALVAGKSLAVVPPAVARDAHALTAFANKIGIDALKITPTHLRALIQSNPGFLPRRLLVTGGEPLSSALVEQLRKLGDFWIANHYGPTETTVGVASTLLDTDASGDIPLGPPLPHCEAHLLDDRLKHVGFYELGELYLGGKQLAYGYAGDATATAMNFLPDISSAPDRSGRMYRTGDLARREPDGTLRFAGRLHDMLMKRHGRRIDTLEIANELVSLPEIVDAAVVLRKDGDQERLDSYLIPARYAVTSEEDEAALIRDWRAVFDVSHGRHETVASNAFVTYGWNSSYDGEPLPVEEVREHIDATVARLVSYEPKRVLDFGCGTGSIVRALAPYCETYVALDPSPVMLEAAQTQWHRMGGGDRVRFLVGGIEALDNMGDEAFDLIVVNSVIQYFPSLGYLRNVLRALRARLTPQGRIFFGDVRDFGLLDAFHASVIKYRFGTEETPEQLASRVVKAVEDELEFVLSPAAFQRLGEEMGLYAESLLKRGHAQNELNKFRYDVLLHCSAEFEVMTETPVPTDCHLTFERELHAANAAPRILTGIPNRRVMDELAMLAGWRGQRDAVEEAKAAQHAVDPEELHRIADNAGVNLRLMPSPVVGRIDAVIGGDSNRPLARTLPYTGAEANEPLRGVANERMRQRIRDVLCGHLPPHQIPDTLTFLSELPQGAGGKVDTARLPSPWVRGACAPKRPPKAGDEAEVLTVLREMLRSQALGPDDDFFVMGGHSLLAIQALVRLRERTGRAPPLRAFFEGATSAAALARLMEWEEKEPTPVIGINNDGSTVTRAEHRLLAEAEPDHPAFTIGFAVTAEGPFDKDAFETALNTVAERHETWRSSYRLVDGKWRRTTADAVRIPIEWRDLTGFGSDAENVATREAKHLKMSRFNLFRGPLVRSMVMRLAPDRHAIVLVVHHIISDGWSTAILARELSDTYHAARNGTRREPVAAADYARIAAAERPPSEEDLDAWRRLLQDVQRELPLPTIFPRPASHNRSGTSIGVELDAATVASAKDLGRQEGATLFMVLAAAYGIALARLANVKTLTIGTPIAMRRTEAQERMLGCFINLLAIPLRIQAGDTFRDVVRIAKNATLAAFELSDIGFSDVVAALGETQDGPRPPLFQTMIELANMPSSTLDLEGLTISELPFDHATSEFELNLILHETGDGAAGWLIYRTALFDRSAAETIFALFRDTLAAGIGRPDKGLPMNSAIQVSDVSFFQTPSER